MHKQTRWVLMNIAAKLLASGNIEPPRTDRENKIFDQFQEKEIQLAIDIRVAIDEEKRLLATENAKPEEIPSNNDPVKPGE